jgi:hypothetical protein
LLQDAESGRVVEVIKPSEHLATLKEKGVRTERPARNKDRNRAQQKAAKFEGQVRDRIFAAIRAKTPSAIAGADLRLVANALWEATGHESRIRLVTLWNWAEKKKATDVVYGNNAKIEKLSEADLRCFVLDCALIDEVRASLYDTRKPTKLTEAAKRQRINIEEIRKTLKSEQLAKHGPGTKTSEKSARQGKGRVKQTA